MHIHVHVHVGCHIHACKLKEETTFVEEGMNDNEEEVGRAEESAVKRLDDNLQSVWCSVC